MPRRDTPAKKARFLVGVARLPYVSKAAEYAGVDRTTPYTWEMEDDDFADEWAKVRELRMPQLVDTAMDVALEGQVDMLKFLITRYDKQEASRERTHVVEIEMVGVDPNDDAPGEFITIEEIETVAG